MAEKDKARVILVGEGKELLPFVTRMKHSGRIAGIFCDDEMAAPDGFSWLGAINAVPAYLAQQPQVHKIYCSVTGVTTEQVKYVQSACKERAVKLCFVLPIVNELGAEIVSRYEGGDVLLTPRMEPLARFGNRLLKRSFDLVLTLLFMLTLFPFVYIFKAIMIKRKRRGTPFVTDRCCGPDGLCFSQISFRGDQCSLARLFNVLMGQMSLVGPECIVLEGENEVTEMPKHLERRGVKAGMTGWAQVNGLTEENRMAADIWYVEHWSLWLDMKILVRSLFYTRVQ